MNAATSRPLKRFYSKATAQSAGTGWSVELDKRPIKTPAGASLILPSEPLAKAVAAEWNCQPETVDIARLHLTRLANVAIDRTPLTRADLVDEVARYCETDLTCFLASETALRRRQDEAWRPWRDWAGRVHGMVLVPVEGVIAAPQPADSLYAARQLAQSYDDFRLTGLAFGCGIFGSAVLSFAVIERALAAGEAFAASVVDECYQEEQWGQDAEAVAARSSKAAEADALGVWSLALAENA
ncbi:MAG: ATP12 family protein [Pseudomonadota bacterium]